MSNPLTSTVYVQSIVSAGDARVTVTFNERTTEPVDPVTGFQPLFSFGRNLSQEDAAAFTINSEWTLTLASTGVTA